MFCTENDSVFVSCFFLLPLMSHIRLFWGVRIPFPHQCEDTVRHYVPWVGARPWPGCDYPLRVIDMSCCLPSNISGVIPHPSVQQHACIYHVIQYLVLGMWWNVSKMLPSRHTSLYQQYFNSKPTCFTWFYVEKWLKYCLCAHRVWMVYPSGYIIPIIFQPLRLSMGPLLWKYLYFKYRKLMDDHGPWSDQLVTVH